MGNRHWGQRKVSVNATGRGPKLTARRLGGDKQSTQPGGVHPGLDTGREARHLRNNCSGRHERNTMSVEINNPYEHMKLSVNARGRGPNLTARRLGGDKQSTQPGDVHPRLDTGHAAGCLRNNCSGRNERNQLSVGKNPLNIQKRCSLPQQNKTPTRQPPRQTTLGPYQDREAQWDDPISRTKDPRMKPTIEMPTPTAKNKTPTDNSRDQQRSGRKSHGRASPHDSIGKQIIT